MRDDPGKTCLEELSNPRQKLPAETYDGQHRLPKEDLAVLRPAPGKLRGTVERAKRVIAG
jgi:hypothetical protein